MPAVDSVAPTHAISFTEGTWLRNDQAMAKHAAMKTHLLGMLENE